MITDAELLELEILLNEQFESLTFHPLFYDKKTNVIYINKETKIEVLYNIVFPNQYNINEKFLYSSLELFKILQLRYFRNNRSIEIRPKV
jgi:hypothetical protein